MKTDPVRAAIIAALPGSQKQIVERTGFVKSTVSRHIVALHHQHEIRIYAWARQKGCGPYSPEFEKGSGPDVPCDLQPIPETVRAKKMRDKRRRTGEIEEDKAKARARYHANRASYKNDPLMAALYGARA